MNPLETINQLGGAGLSGALCYTGTRKIYNLPSKNSMMFQVNGRRGYQTFIEVKLDPSDTYTVSILSRKYGTTSKSIEHRALAGVYCDELQGVFEDLYDDHMNVKNKGFIPLD